MQLLILYALFLIPVSATKYVRTADDLIADQFIESGTSEPFNFGLKNLPQLLDQKTAEEQEDDGAPYSIALFMHEFLAAGMAHAILGHKAVYWWDVGDAKSLDHLRNALKTAGEYAQIQEKGSEGSAATSSKILKTSSDFAFVISRDWRKSVEYWRVGSDDGEEEEEGNEARTSLIIINKNNFRALIRYLNTQNELDIFQSLLTNGNHGEGTLTRNLGRQFASSEIQIVTETILSAMCSQKGLNWFIDAMYKVENKEIIATVLGYGRKNAVGTQEVEVLKNTVVYPTIQEMYQLSRKNPYGTVAPPFMHFFNNKDSEYIANQFIDDNKRITLRIQKTQAELMKKSKDTTFVAAAFLLAARVIYGLESISEEPVHTIGDKRPTYDPEEGSSKRTKPGAPSTSVRRRSKFRN